MHLGWGKVRDFLVCIYIYWGGGRYKHSSIWGGGLQESGIRELGAKTFREERARGQIINDQEAMEQQV